MIEGHTWCVCAKSPGSCPTLCHRMDCSPPGASVHGILQARRLGWAVLPSSRGSSRPRDWSGVSCSSCTSGRFFTAALITPRATTQTCKQRGLLKTEFLESKRTKFPCVPQLSNCVLQSSNYNLTACYFLSGQTRSPASPIHLSFTNLNKYLK